MLRKSLRNFHKSMIFSHFCSISKCLDIRSCSLICLVSLQSHKPTKSRSSLKSYPFKLALVFPTLNLRDSLQQFWGMHLCKVLAKQSNIPHGMLATLRTQNDMFPKKVKLINQSSSGNKKRCILFASSVWPLVNICVF